MRADFTRESLDVEGNEAVVSLELAGGVTYYFDVYGNVSGVSCSVSVTALCDEHLGGEATYTEQAVCDRCGESYGDLIPCEHHLGGVASCTEHAVCENCLVPYGQLLDHTGGEATYHEHAICVNCGKEYGDLLVCGHMCHAGGIRGFIWKIFDKLYDYFGIETVCECGDEH